jgi:hypothetical protein
MRGAPSESVTCYVCGSRFTVRSELVITRRHTVLKPDVEACPFCDTPVKKVPALGEGTAKGLVLTAAGFPEEVKEYGTAEDYLEAFTLLPRDVDTLVELAEGLDLAGWAQDNARRLERRKNPSVQAVSRFLPKLQAMVERGELSKRLQQAAQHVKDEYSARRERHLAIFQKRKQRQ